MTDWEKLLSHPDYITDTGNREKGGIFSRGQIRLGNQSGPDAITLEEAFNIIARLPNNPMLLVKTNKWRGKPGGFYAKAFLSKGADWDTLIQVLNENQARGQYQTRKVWVCGPGRKWN
jgi:hypothetical protein